MNHGRFRKVTSKETTVLNLPVPVFNLQGDRTKRTEILKDLKDFIQRERALTYKLHTEGSSGRAVTKRLAQLMDAVVSCAYRYARENAPDEEVPVAWIATGGYGREELHPFSDVDIMLFHLGDTPSAYVEHLMGTVLQLLWDAGLTASHACRNPKDCRRIMEKDYITASALLEGRYIAGDEALFKHFEKEVLFNFFSNHLFSFIADRIEEARTRHRSRGMSPYLIEPNVKEDPGGLRDAQLIFWLLRLSQLLPSQLGGLLPLLGEEELLSIQKASDLLLRIRTQLHILSDRKYDILERALQEEVAEALGYEESNGLPGATGLMREYFTAAGKIRFHLNTVMARFETAKPSITHRTPVRRPMGTDLVAIESKLYFNREDALNSPWKAKKMMEFFLSAQRHHLEPSQQALKLIHEHLWLVDEGFRNDPEVAKLFMGILEGTGDVSKTLGHMRDCGLLGKYVPEFDDLVGFVHYESPHSHTVDEHSLMAIGAIDALWQRDRPERAQKRRLLDETGKQAVLRLALLLHDIGKPRGPQHPLLGAAIIPTIARRLYLEEDDARLLEFLVKNHLEMAHLFEHRDHGEETALSTFAQKAVSLNNLKLLYILTFADIQASGAWFAWQDSLLWELYQKVAIILSEDMAHKVIESPKAFKEAFLALARTKGMEAEALRHCDLVPPRYIIEVEPEEALVHLELIRELKEEGAPIALNLLPANNFIEAWLSTEDRPTRFSQMSGIFAAKGLNIISAQAYTRKDGIILDHFRVAPSEEQCLTDSFCSEVREEFLSVFGGRKSLAEMLHSRRRRVVPGKRPPAKKGTTRVYIDNKSSPDYTIIDVVSPDKVGLLYTISLCLADCGLDIHFAKVATKLDQAIDVFYVTDKERRTKIFEEEKIKQIKAALTRACMDTDLHEGKDK